MKRVYLTGPMTGFPDNNRAAFNKAAARLRKLGFTVVSLIEFDGEFGVTMHRTDYYRRGLPYLAQCNLVVVLPGWKKSVGSVLTVVVASTLGMQTLNYKNLLPVPEEELPFIKFVGP